MADTKSRHASFIMKDIKLPLCEIGPAGLSRMQVQNYYDNLLKLGVGIRDAMRGTEHALNIRNLQTNTAGKTVTYFEESVKLTEDVKVVYKGRNGFVTDFGGPLHIEGLDNTQDTTLQRYGAWRTDRRKPEVTLVTDSLDAAKGEVDKSKDIKEAAAPDKAKAFDALVSELKRSMRYSSPHDIDVQRAEFSVDIRYWGDWYTPSDVSDEDREDYDHQEPTEGTRKRAAALCADIEKRFGVVCKYQNQEKNWLTFYIKDK
jgi:hypothetical protein